MNDRHLDSMWTWHESEWEAAFFKRLILLAVQNRADTSQEADQPPLVLTEGTAYYQQCMYHTHRAAVVAMAESVAYVDVTAQLVHDARCDGTQVLPSDLEQRRRRSLEVALAVFSTALVHADDLKAIQRFGTAVLARGDAVLRAKHANGGSLAYAIPKIPIPRDLYEIGQTRVRAAFGELTHDPIVGALPQLSAA
jgi:hypothetical protein